MSRKRSAVSLFPIACSVNDRLPDTEGRETRLQALVPKNLVPILKKAYDYGHDHQVCPGQSDEKEARKNVHRRLDDQVHISKDCNPVWQSACNGIAAPRW